MISTEVDQLKQDILARFLRYAVIDTQSDRSGQQHPSTPGQWELLRLIEAELRQIGIDDLQLDGNGYLTARIPSNLPEHRQVPAVGFMAHVDTAEDMSGKGVKPKVIDAYAGGDIELSGNRVLSAADNPELANYLGETLITSDGTTLLGADDKAGAAEIVGAAAYLLAHPELEHGEVELIFTPDEETGSGMDRFPIERLHSEFCCTMDGGGRGEVETECFNAVRADIDIEGVMYHLGSARGRMVNAVTLASALVSQLPQAESPEATDGRYGYYCPLEISGTAAAASVKVYLRDFEKDGIERRKRVLAAMGAELMQRCPGSRIDISFVEQYRNMRDHIDANPNIMSTIESAAAALDMKLARQIIRGGTDGARLAEMGIPTPNIFTGGYNYHSRYEWAALPVMVEAARLILEIILTWGRAKR